MVQVVEQKISYLLLDGRSASKIQHECLSTSSFLFFCKYSTKLAGYWCTVLLLMQIRSIFLIGNCFRSRWESGSSTNEDSNCCSFMVVDDQKLEKDHSDDAILESFLVFYNMHICGRAGKQEAILPKVSCYSV